MPLAKTHKWHIFLSHIWANAQDQCATIKRQLCLLLPGVRIFLDVDDLEDIGSLEDYISQSACIMVFISKGYFKSPNCLREVRAFVAAKRADQGLILVRETAPTHGAASLEELRAECPPDLAAEVFTRAHLQLLIPFYRQARGGGWVGTSRC